MQTTTKLCFYVPMQSNTCHLAHYLWLPVSSAAPVHPTYQAFLAAWSACLPVGQPTGKLNSPGNRLRVANRSQVVSEEQASLSSREGRPPLWHIVAIFLSILSLPVAVRASSSTAEVIYWPPQFSSASSTSSIAYFYLLASST